MKATIRIAVAAVAVMAACMANSTDLVVTSSSNAGYVDSAFHHMSHIMRSLGDVNGNGVVDAGEIVDLATWSAATRTVNDAVAVCGEGSQICHTNVEYVAAVPPHQSRQSKGIYFPQPVTTNGEGQLMGVVQRLRIDNMTCLGYTNTFHVHFRWDGPVQTNYATQCTLMYHEYNPNNISAGGMRIYIETAGNSWTSGYLRFGWYGQQNPDSGSAFPIAAGKWYDLVISRFRRKKQDGSWDSSYDIYADLVVPAASDSVCETTLPRSFVGAHAYVSKSKNDIIFGGDETVTEPIPITNGTDAVARAFRGVIDAYECWDDYAPLRRSSTPAQVREIVSGYHGAIAAIGNVNGRADEFSDEAPAAVFDCDTMEWRQFRKTLTAENPSVKFKVNLGTDTFVTNWPQIVSLTPIFGEDAPMSCPVEVYVNDRLAQKGNLRSASGRALYIGAKYMKPDADGCATFEIRRTGNLEGSVSLDAVAVCGGGSFGRHNNSMYDFENENYASHFAIFGDRNAKHVRRCQQVQSWNTVHDYFAFYLPADSIGRETYKGLFAITSGTTARAKVFVNGTEVLDMSSQAASHPNYSFDIPGDLLKPGLNEISVNGADSSAKGWLNFDCIQLRADGEEFHRQGFFILFR